MKSSLRGLLIGMIAAAVAVDNDKYRQTKIVVNKQAPKKKAKLQSVKNHKSKPSNKYKGSKPIKMQTRKSNHKRT